jgi:hypothetical protein
MLKVLILFSFEQMGFGLKTHTVLVVVLHLEKATVLLI